jgi:hypothetical protein
MLGCGRGGGSRRDGSPKTLITAWARTVSHFDLPEEAAIASQIDRELVTPPDQLVDLDVLAEAVHVDQPDRHHMDVIAFGLELQRSKRARPEPVLALVDPDDVPIDAEANGLLAEKHPIATVRAAPATIIVTTVPAAAPIIITIPALCHDIVCQRAGQQQRRQHGCELS